VPLADWLLAIGASSCALYLFVFDTELVQNIFGSRLADRPNNPNTTDVVVAVLGVIFLLEATRRSLGPPLMIVAMVFLGYTFLGPYAPGFLAWKGASFNAVAYHQWLSTEGVFGIASACRPIWCSSSCCSAHLLDKAGAGNYFIKVAFSLMGHFSGGPAKAAVVASGMTGLISGSSIANVVTTGTFTIPMMRRVGFSREKAGAVEVASSVNGQIMPPVMGAAAFLMVEYIGISYFEVVKHAFLPAIISYIALVYIVHLEALKQGMEGLPRAGEVKPLKWALLSFGITMAVLLAAASGVYYLFLGSRRLEPRKCGCWRLSSCWRSSCLRQAGPGGTDTAMRGRAVDRCDGARRIRSVGAFGLFYFMDVVQALAGEATLWVVSVLIIAVYVALSRYCAPFPSLRWTIRTSRWCAAGAGPDGEIGPAFPAAGFRPDLVPDGRAPVAVAVGLLGDRADDLHPAHPAPAVRDVPGAGPWRDGLSGLLELIDGMIAGARNMIGIGIATAAAGIIVGAVSQTGVGAVLAALVEFLSRGRSC
jgi:TRAP transporter 4TM/12TM fusion protein